MSPAIVEAATLKTKPQWSILCGYFCLLKALLEALVFYLCIFKNVCAFYLFEKQGLEKSSIC